MDFFETPLQNRPHNVWVAHSGFKTEQCSETLNALKPFKSVFFSTGCANMMAMVHVEQFSIKHVHLTVVQMLCVHLTIVHGKNDGAHVRSMPKRSLFWQLGRHDHLGRWLCITITLPNSDYRIFLFIFP